MFFTLAAMSVSVRSLSDDAITPSDSASGGSLSIVGIEGAQGLTRGTDRVVMFISTPTQSATDSNKMDFTVDRFAIVGQGSSTATMHILSPGLPGTIDTSSHEVQIDVDRLTSDVQSASNIDIHELKRSMRSAGTPVVSATLVTQAIGAKQATFLVKNIAIVNTDGGVKTFNMEDNPADGIYDVDTMKVSIVVPGLSGMAADFATAGSVPESSTGVTAPEDTRAIRPETTSSGETTVVQPTSQEAIGVPGGGGEGTAERGGEAGGTADTDETGR